MPLQIVGSDAFGVTVRKDDGSTVQIPRGLAQQILGPMLAQNGPGPGALDGMQGGPTFPMQGGYTAQPFMTKDGIAGGVNANAVDQSRVTPDGGMLPPAPDAPMQPPPDARIQQMQDDEGDVLARRDEKKDEPAAAQAAPPPAAPAPQPPAAAPAAVPPVQPPRRSAGAGAQQQPGIMQQLQQGGDAQARAELAAGEAKAQMVEQAGPKREGAIQQAIAADALAQMDFQKRMQQADERSKALSQEVASIAQQKIDPNQIFGDMSTAGRIATFAGLFIGGAVGTRTGRNEALETVNNMVNRSVQAQMANLQNRREAVKDQSSLLAQDVSRGVDMYTAQTKATATGLLRAADLIDAQGAKFAGAVERANAAELAGKARQEALKVMSTYDAQLKEVAAKNYATSSENMRAKNALAANTATDIMGKQLGYSAHIQTIGAERDKAAAAAAKDQRELSVPSPAYTGTVDQAGNHTMKVAQGPLMVAYDKEKATKGGELIAKTNAAVTALQNYVESIRKNRGSYGGPGATAGYQDMEAKRGEAFANLFELKFQRSPTKEDRENYIDVMLPPPQGMLNMADPYTKLNSAINSITTTYNSQVGTYFQNPRPLALPANMNAAPPSRAAGQPQTFDEYMQEQMGRYNNWALGRGD